jgi:hypothetical protein
MPEDETYTAHDEKEQGTEEEDQGFGSSTEQERERLKFNDYVVQGSLYNEWSSYDHPTYGEIEIGGWTKMSSRLPHPFMLQDLVHRNASAVMYAASQTPDVSMEVFETKKIEDDLYRVRLRLVNKNAIPTMTFHSVKNKLYPQDMLTVNGNRAQVISGGKLTDKYNNRVDYKEHKPGIQFLRIPGNQAVEYQFLVEGSGSITVEYNSRKAGTLTAKTELN